MRARLLLLLALLMPAAGRAQSPEGALCRGAIAAAEAANRIPDAFLFAIARVESGRPENGETIPWPWTVNAEGQGAFYPSKAEAVAAVQQLQGRGVRSIDVGCLQVNLQQHPEAFASLEQAFDPAANAHFAAGFLLTLFGQFGSWPLAAAAYHSQTQALGAAYQRQVLAAWAMPDRPGPPPPPSAAKHGVAAPPQAGHGAGAPPAPGPAQTASRGQIAPPAPVAAALGRPALAFGRDPPAGPPRGTGRSLAAYRAAPVPLALRLPPRPG